MSLSASIDEDVLSQRRINHHQDSSHRKLLNKMDSTHCTAILDPLQVLPTELWSEVLRYAVSNDTDGTVAPDLVLALTSVSTIWLRATVSTPFLWTTVVLDDTEHQDLHIRTEACLHLSRDRPLTVILRYAEEDLGDILSRVAAHSNRIEGFRSEILTSGSGPLRDVTSRRYHEVLRAFDAMPNILHLHWHGSDEYITPSDFVRENECSHLQTISNVSLTRSEIISGLFRHLKAVTTFATMESILSDLQQMPFLEHVKIGRAYIPQVYKAPNLSDVKQYPEELEEIKWKTLQWNEVGNPLFTKVLRATSNLLELNIGINWQDLPGFLSSLAHVSRLQTLKLIVRLPANRQFQPPPLPPSRYLKRLSLIFLAQPRHFVHAAVENLSSLFRTLTIWAYSVENLTMRLSTSDPAPFDYIESLHNLRSLQLFTKDASVVNNWTPNLDPGTLAELELTAPSALQRIFITPSTRRLTLRSSTTSNTLDEPVRPKPGQTTNVASLSLHKFSCNLRAFTGIRELGIDGLQYVSNYLITMIAFPSQCPQLEELCLHDVPEWDLVFLLLERRNIHPPAPVSPIRILTVPALPGPFAMKPLVGLLGCKPMERPSNIELSSQGFREIFFDFNLNGCQACLRNFKACDSQVITPAYSYSLYAMPNLTKIPEEYEAPCSPDIWLWIERRKARVDAWNQFSKQPAMFTRRINCQKQTEFRITESTLPGDSCLEHAL